MRRFFSYCSFSFPSRLFRYRYSLRNRALRRSMCGTGQTRGEVQGVRDVWAPVTRECGRWLRLKEIRYFVIISSLFPACMRYWALA